MVLSNKKNRMRKSYLISLTATGLALLCFFNFSCVQKKHVESPKAVTTSSNENATNLVSINKDLLKGIWGTNPTENASFQILQDSIYYVDANRRLKYEVSGNIFICYDENGDTNFVCFVNKLDKDSLVMKNKHTNENSGFIRFK